MTASFQGRPFHAASLHSNAAGSITSLGPSTSCGWKREAGSGTSCPPLIRYRYSVPAPASGSRCSYHPSRSRLRETDFCPTTNSTPFADGAHRRKRTPPPGCTSAPKGMEWPARTSSHQHEEQQGAPRRLVYRAEPVVRAFKNRIVGVEEPGPVLAIGHFRKLEVDDVMVRIRHHEERLVFAALLDAAFLRPAVEHHAEALGAPVLPVRLLHLGRFRGEPGHVLHIEVRVVRTGEEAAALQDGVAHADLDQALGELEELAAAVVQLRPIDPVDFVVLAVGVVVAELAAAELVAGEDHRRAERQQQGREKIALLPLSDGGYRRIFRRTLGAVVEGDIVGVAVAVLLAVRLVVLLVVRDEVVEGEAVVGSDEIDARPRAPAAPVEHV